VCAFLNGGGLLAAKIVGGIKITESVFLRFELLITRVLILILIIRGTELVIGPEGYGVAEGDGFG